jgi:hypothetical protein
MVCSSNSSRARSAFALRFICAVSLTAGAHGAPAGVNVWTAHGPYQTYGAALAIDPITPSTLYAGTDAGVYKSTDGGGSWTVMNTGRLSERDQRGYFVHSTIPVT